MCAGPIAHGKSNEHFATPARLVVNIYDALNWWVSSFIWPVPCSCSSLISHSLLYFVITRSKSMIKAKLQYIDPDFHKQFGEATWAARVGVVSWYSIRAWWTGTW